MNIMQIIDREWIKYVRMCEIGEMPLWLPPVLTILCWAILIGLFVL